MSARHWMGVLILALAGCGGGAASGAEPKTAEANDEPSSEKGPGEPSSERPAAEAPKAAEGESAPKEGEGAASESTTLEGSELESVLQSVLADPELLDHLHLNKSGRAPLKISGPNLPDKLKVVAGSYDVKVVPEPSSKTAPVLVFTKIEREGNQVRLHYRFDVEGIKGSATVGFKNGQWVLASNRVIEK